MAIADDEPEPPETVPNVGVATALAVPPSPLPPPPVPVTSSTVRTVLDGLDRWRREEVRVALARVVDLDGPAGAGDAAMAVNERGEVAGHVSDEQVAGEVVAEALRVLEMGRPKLVTFGCGRVHVLLEPLDW